MKSESILNRYLDADVLTRLAGRKLEPHGLVLGGLAGTHRSPLSGFAIEFAGHREYVPGDDPRHIDWRLYFLRDKYFIKQYETDTNFVCHLVLDVSASMRFGEGQQQKLRYAAGLIATLAHAVVKQRDQVSLSCIDDQVRGFVAPSSSPAQLLRFAENLDSQKSVEKTDLGACIIELAGRMRRREIVFIFSDFFLPPESLEPAILRLRYSAHEVVLFHVLHGQELRFDFDGGIRFRGLETDEELPADVNDVRAEYLAAVKRHFTQLDELCSRHRIERVLVDTSCDPAESLVNYLNQRSIQFRG